jgi:hypothetical protein
MNNPYEWLVVITYYDGYTKKISEGRTNIFSLKKIDGTELITPKTVSILAYRRRKRNKK